MSSLEFPRPITALDVGELLLLSALWGGSFLFMRIAVPEFGAAAMITVRLGIAALLLLPLLRGHDLRPWWKPLCVVALLNSAIPAILFAYAVQTLPAGFASVLNATAAWWGTLIGWWAFGVRPGARSLVGLSIGIVGVTLMVAHELADAEADAAVLPAVFAALAATACYGANAHYTRQRLADAPATAVAASSLLIAFGLTLVPGVVLWPTAVPSAPAWTAALALGAFSTSLALWLYFRLIARVGPTRSMTVPVMIPAFGVLFGTVFLDEPLTPARLLGGALVMLGTAIALGLQWPWSRANA